MMDELRTIGPQSLAIFLDRWYDLRGTSGSEAARELDQLPTPLVRWYALVGNRSEVSSYYAFKPASELTLDRRVVSFCSLPHDGDFWWGYSSAEDDDPETFESEDGALWQPTGHKLSALLLYIAVSSAVFDSRHGLVNMASGRENCIAAVNQLNQLEPEIWSWPDPAIRFYYADGVLAQAGGVGEDFDYQMVLAAKTEEALDPFRAIEWEWSSRDE